MAFIVCPIVFYIPRFFEIRSFVKVYAYNETIDCSALFLNEPSHQLMFLKDNQSQSFLKVLNRGTLQYENQWMNLTIRIFITVKLVHKINIFMTILDSASIALSGIEFESILKKRTMNEVSTHRLKIKR